MKLPRGHLARFSQAGRRLGIFREEHRRPIPLAFLAQPRKDRLIHFCHSPMCTAGPL